MIPQDIVLQADTSFNAALTPAIGQLARVRRSAGRSVSRS
jgi:hypothetical protein